MIKGTERTYDPELWKGRKLFAEVARGQGKTTEKRKAPRNIRKYPKESLQKLNEKTRKRLVFNSFLNAIVPAR